MIKTLGAKFREVFGKSKRPPRPEHLSQCCINDARNFNVCSRGKLLQGSRYLQDRQEFKRVEHGQSLKKLWEQWTQHTVRGAFRPTILPIEKSARELCGGCVSLNQTIPWLWPMAKSYILNPVSTVTQL